MMNGLRCLAASLALIAAGDNAALLQAAYEDDLTRVEALVRDGADVTAANRYGITPLTLACQNGNAAVVKLLLDKGADPNTTRDGGETALMTAARTGRLSVVQALLDAGAEPNSKERRGQTALMWAAAEGHADVVELLIARKAEFRAPLKSGFTPLSFAVRNGHIAVTQLLLKAGADVNRAMSEAKGGRDKPVKHTSPLMLAMENGHFELAAMLLEKGADANDARTGFAPLHAMSWIRKPSIGDGETGTPAPTPKGKYSSLDFVRVLVDHGAAVDIRRKSGGARRKKISVPGTTPFLCAASTADVPLMELLRELGADPTHRNQIGQTALMMAAGIAEGAEADGPGRKPEHLAAVTYLLELGADIDAICKNGETAMHGAAYKSLPKVVALLDASGADIAIWSQKSKQGRTPLSIAQGYRPGNFKPSAETVVAIETVMRAHGITPPPPPHSHDEAWRN